MQITLTQLSNGNEFTLNENNVVFGEKVGTDYADGTRLFYLLSEKTIKQEVEVAETFAEIMVLSAAAGDKLVGIPYISKNDIGDGFERVALFNVDRVLNTYPDDTNASFLFDATLMAPDLYVIDGDETVLAGYLAGGWEQSPSPSPSGSV